MSECPKCHEEVEDLDGFGVLAHDECGYCSHPDSYAGICKICGAVTDRIQLRVASKLNAGAARAYDFPRRIADDG